MDAIIPSSTNSGVFLHEEYGYYILRKVSKERNARRRDKCYFL